MNRHERRAESKRRIEVGRVIMAAARKRHAGFVVRGKWQRFAPPAEPQPSEPEVAT